MSQKDPRSSRVSGFYKLPVQKRLERISDFADLTEDDRKAFANVQSLSIQKADKMVENVGGVFGLPLGFAANFRINKTDHFCPMVIEEPSVVAAASHAAKLLRDGDGIATWASSPIMIGQIQICEVEDLEFAKTLLLTHADELLEEANETQPRLCERGGGAREVRVRLFPETAAGPMLIVHLLVDVRDAMGANMVNTMVEAIAPKCSELVGGEVCLKILSNLADERLVYARGNVPISRLANKEKNMSGMVVAKRIVKASAFAEVDPYRAATHNKGMMNGIDAFLIATGQDWRAVEAGVHAYAARSGTYSALATWRIEGDQLVGNVALPMQVGTVGGIVQVHPLVGINLRILRISSASELGEIAAAVGLAQNLAAILALATEGIQRGHMALHARNIASAAGAREDQVEALARQLVEKKTINVEAATRLLEEENA